VTYHLAPETLEVAAPTARVRARETVIEAALFARLPSTVHEGLAMAVEAYGGFIGRPARLAKAAVP
jgi:hypothetical protein